MKALTLTQPWATLVVIGAKVIETRSWRTSYRGSLAIHAAKGLTAEARESVNRPLFRDALLRAGYRSLSELPLGAVVGEVELVSCRVMQEDGTLAFPGQMHAGLELPTIFRFLDREDHDPAVELAFGDYTPGRFGWLLRNPIAWENPVPARGALGLWEWDSTGVFA